MNAGRGIPTCLAERLLGHLQHLAHLLGQAPLLLGSILARKHIKRLEELEPFLGATNHLATYNLVLYDSRMHCTLSRNVAVVTCLAERLLSHLQLLAHLLCQAPCLFIRVWGSGLGGRV